jgi:hypothetical protein
MAPKHASTEHEHDRPADNLISAVSDLDIPSGSESRTADATLIRPVDETRQHLLAAVENAQSMPATEHEHDRPADNLISDVSDLDVFSGSASRTADATLIRPVDETRQHLLAAVENAYGKLKISHGLIGNLPGRIVNLGSLIDFTQSLEQLQAACRSDPSLTEQVVRKGSIMYHIFKVTEIDHGSSRCDIVCLEFLALFATTEKGADYVHAHLQKFTAWANPSSWGGGPSFHAFAAKVKPVLLNMQMTLDKIKNEARVEQIVGKKESVDTLDLGHCGILLDTNRHGIRRRVSALPTLYRDMSRSDFCGLFPKGCPGCIGMNLICAAEVLDDSQLVWQAVREMLNDPPGEILTRGELDILRRMSRSQYKRQDPDHPYPFMGNCLDFGYHSDIVKVARGLGELIASETFAKAMARNRLKCIAYVTAKVSGRISEDIEEFCKTIIA